MSSGATSLHEPSLDQKGTARKKGNGKDTTTMRGEMFEPYTATVTVFGVAPILFHAYDVEEVERKGNLPKGSAEKKVDNIESFVYRNNNLDADGVGDISIPGVNFKAALANAAKRFKDPSSPRKSAKDLIRAGIAINPHMSAVCRDGTPLKTWEALDKRGVNVQQSKITRTRPLVLEGWTIDFEIEVIDAEHITDEFLRDIVDRAGRYSGLGDFRPDFGRFRVDSFEVIQMV